jgi:hypothetical protein
VENVVIYYRLKKNEKIETVVEQINILIHQLEKHHLIKGVFIDEYEDRTEFNEMVSYPLSEIDYIVMGNLIEDEFDNLLINELSKSENFNIRRFKEI